MEKDTGVTLDLEKDEETQDWLRAGRLRKLAEAGDEEAIKELERMTGQGNMEEEISED